MLWLGWSSQFTGPAPICQLVDPQSALAPTPVVVTSTDALIKVEGMTVTVDNPFKVALVIVLVPTGVGVGVNVGVGGIGVGVFVGVGVGVKVGVGGIGVGVFVGVGVGVGVFVGVATTIPPVNVKVELAPELQVSLLNAVKTTLYDPLLAGAVIENTSL
jgi:hypothetical protein